MKKAVIIGFIIAMIINIKMTFERGYWAVGGEITIPIYVYLIMLGYENRKELKEALKN